MVKWRGGRAATTRPGRRTARPSDGEPRRSLRARFSGNACSVALLARLLEAVELLLHELLRGEEVAVVVRHHIEEGIGGDGAVARILEHGADEVRRAER